MPFTVVDEGDVSATRTSLWTSGKSLTALKKQTWMTVHTGDGNKVTEVVLPGKGQTEQASWLSTIRQDLSLLALPLPFQPSECALPAELQRA